MYECVLEIGNGHFEPTFSNNSVEVFRRKLQEEVDDELMLCRSQPYFPGAENID